VTTTDPAPLGRPDPGPDRRPRMAFWDRVKILLLLIGVWAILVWNLFVEDPNVTFVDAVIETTRTGAVLLFLAAVEALRQVHYLLSEQSAGWHRFWSEGVFGGVNRRLARMNDWTRYRIGRLLKIVFLVTLVAIALGEITDRSPVTVLFELPALLVQGLPMLFQVLFLFFYIAIQLFGMFWFLSRGGVDTYMLGDIKTRFGDVWGQDPVLDRVKENIIFLEDPEAIESRGGYVPTGILLWGPPGTGKTLMAEAVAGETGKPFVFVDPGAFNAMFMGVGILKVKSLFRKLRRLSVRYGGVVVFFDEADSLGSRGMLGQPQPGAAASQWAHKPGCNGLGWVDPTTAGMVLRHELPTGVEDGARRQRFVMGGMGIGGGSGTLQALLTELSGLKKPRGFFNRTVRKALGMQPKPPPKYRILVMMATNMPQALDEALLRPGRIDRIYKVGYPSKAGRIRTYEGYLEKVPHELTADEVDKLATITPYATGATIKDLVNEALINAIRDERESIVWKDIVKAKQLKDLGPPEDVEYIERERHAVAIHEACHAVVAYRVRRHLTIDIATIEKGGTYLGMVASIPPEDQFTRWRSEYEADIMTSLASLAGERMFFEGDNSSGVSGDLNTATLIATYMEGYWGMGRTVSSYGIAREQGLGIGGGGDGGVGKGKGGRKTREEELLASGLGQRIEDKLGELLRATERLLAENRSAVLAIAHALESHKTLTGDDIEAIIEGRPGPLVDGRAYHSPEFADEAEEYHSLALEAHRGHAGVGVALPRLRSLDELPAGESRRRRRAGSTSPRGDD
jgi:cell division protease FtsH